MPRAESLDKLAEVQHLAATFLRGEITAIEAAVRLSRYRHSGLPKALDEYLDVMMLVDSETDAIPFGERRELWHPDARADEDKKHDDAQAWARPLVEEACKNLIALIGPD